MPPVIERLKLVQSGLNLIGVNYIWGGKDPKIGLDCSGYFTYRFWVLSGKTIDYRANYNAQRLYGISKQIGPEDVKPGDAVFYGKSADRITHIMMLLYKPLGFFIPGMVVGACGGDSSTTSPIPTARVQVRGSVRYRDDFFAYGSFPDIVKE